VRVFVGGHDGNCAESVPRSCRDPLACTSSCCLRGNAKHWFSLSPSGERAFHKTGYGSTCATQAPCTSRYRGDVGVSRNSGRSGTPLALNMTPSTTSTIRSATAPRQSSSNGTVSRRVNRIHYRTADFAPRQVPSSPDRASRNIAAFPLTDQPFDSHTPLIWSKCGRWRPRRSPAFVHLLTGHAGATATSDHVREIGTAEEPTSWPRPRLLSHDRERP